MMIRLISVVSCLPSALSHGYMTVPASRNLNQCPSSSGPCGDWMNKCLTDQDRSGGAAACEGLPCAGCVKIPPEACLGGGGHDTCTPGNYPGQYPIRNNVCGDFQQDDLQVTWQSGSVVDVEVRYILNHAGSYQFRLCLDGSDTDECFNEMPLKFEDGQDWHWVDSDWLPMRMPPPSGYGKDMKDRIVIPDGVECDHCTLNWRWDTALEASVFSNCADVAISSRSRPTDAFSVVTSDGLCLDIPGSNVANGQSLWTWDCTGTDNQQFIFAGDSWQITSAIDPSFCVDAGSDMSAGNQIFLWECNGHDQQVFGYDADAGSIYLANSGSDASLCLKPEGAWNSAAVTIAYCNNQDNGQQWSLSSTSAGLQSVFNQTHAGLTVASSAVLRGGLAAAGSPAQHKVVNFI